MQEQFVGRDPNGGPFGTQPSLAVYGVFQFFQNGGIGAWVVRLDAPSSAVAQAMIGPLTLRASSPGSWANTSSRLQPRGAKQTQARLRNATSSTLSSSPTLGGQLLDAGGPGPEYSTAVGFVGFEGG